VSFLCTSLFGGVGRAPARLLIQRANLSSDKDSFAVPTGGLLPPRRHAWTADLEDMRSFYTVILSPERIPVRVLFFDDHTPPIIGYSDGCSSVDKNVHGLGIVMWDVHDGTAASPDKPAGSGQWAHDACPLWFVDRCLAHTNKIICPFELYASICWMLTFRHMFKGNRRLAVYQDNGSAWSLMVHGFSDSVLMSEGGNVYHLVRAALGVDKWTEHVPSLGQMADLPSRWP